MDPFSIAAIIGAVVSVVGGLIGADAANRKANAEKEIADLNAGLLEQQAQDANVRGNHEAAMLRWNATRTIGQLQTAAGASGLAMDSGSTLGLEADSRFFAEADAATAINNARREAWGYEAQATIMRRRGQLGLEAGQAEATGHMLNGGLNAAQQTFTYFGKRGG